MKMYTVSHTHIIRNMDAEELQEEWERTSESHKSWMKKPFYDEKMTNWFLNKYNMLNRLYHQQTGKTLN